MNNLLETIVFPEHLFQKKQELSDLLHDLEDILVNEKTPFLKQQKVEQLCFRKTRMQKLRISEEGYILIFNIFNQVYIARSLSEYGGVPKSTSTFDKNLFLLIEESFTAVELSLKFKAILEKSFESSIKLSIDNQPIKIVDAFYDNNDFIFFEQSDFIENVTTEFVKVIFAKKEKLEGVKHLLCKKQICVLTKFLFSLLLEMSAEFYQNYVSQYETDKILRYSVFSVKRSFFSEILPFFMNEFMPPMLIEPKKWKMLNDKLKQGSLLSQKYQQCDHSFDEINLENISNRIFLEQISLKVEPSFVNAILANLKDYYFSFLNSEKKRKVDSIIINFFLDKMENSIVIVDLSTFMNRKNKIFKIEKQLETLLEIKKKDGSLPNKATIQSLKLLYLEGKKKLFEKEKHEKACLEFIKHPTFKSYVAHIRQSIGEYSYLVESFFEFVSILCIAHLYRNEKNLYFPLKTLTQGQTSYCGWPLSLEKNEFCNNFLIFAESEKVNSDSLILINQTNKNMEEFLERFLLEIFFEKKIVSFLVLLLTQF
jgi:hypothetical protein